MYYESKKGGSLIRVLILFCLLIITVILVSLINKLDSKLTPEVVATEDVGTDTVLQDFNIENLVENSSYSVVGISKLNKKDTSIFVKNSEEKLGIGSGIIVTSNGYILTNYSISGEKNATCYATLKNGEVYPAKVVWVNKDLDISIIKISASNLLALSLRRF